MITTAKIVKFNEKLVLIEPSESISRELMQKNISCLEIRLDDGRRISADQRKKIFALFMDISRWSGYDPKEIKEVMKAMFSINTGEDMDFSLSNVDMTTSKEFINYLIEFCFQHNIGTKDTLLTQTDDIGKYLYQCLEYRKCVICNKQADVHHVDRVGMGMNRQEIAHVGMKAIALCREHHMQAHQNEKRLFDAYHVYGIKLDSYLCKRLNLKSGDNKGVG